MLANALTEFDYGRLGALARAIRHSGRPERARFLEARLKHIAALGEAGLDMGQVWLGSSVAFREIRSGTAFEYRLSLPTEADISRGTISVLTPLGAALLGRGEGESFSYECPGGVVDVLVERVSHEG